MKENMTEVYWSRFPDSYDQNQEYVVGRELLEQIIAQLNQLTELGEVVEFGCGTGFFTAGIAEKADHVLATDLSDSLLGTARIRLQDNPNITFRKENCMESKLEPASFDSVFMANLIHVVADPVSALEESSRVLRRGGRIVIVTFTGHGMGLWGKIKLGVRFVRAWGKPPETARSLSPSDVASMLEQQGFAIEQSKLLGNQTKAIFLVARKK